MSRHLPEGDAYRVVGDLASLAVPETLTALIAVRELAKSPGSSVIHNLITSRAVPELIDERGGVAVRARVGHSYIKGLMAQTGAIFSGPIC